jgi:hypothetical protein
MVGRRGLLRISLAGAAAGLAGCAGIQAATSAAGITPAMAQELWGIGLGMAEAAADVLLPGSVPIVNAAIQLAGPILERLTAGTPQPTDAADLAANANILILHSAPELSVRANTLAPIAG